MVVCGNVTINGKQPVPGTFEHIIQFGFYEHTEINFCDQNISKENIEQFSSMLMMNNSVRKVKLVNVGLTKETLLKIVGAVWVQKNVEELDVSHNKPNEFHDSVFLILEKLKYLKKLNISNMNLSNSFEHFVNAIEKNGSLEYLDISGNSIDAENCSKIINAMKVNTGIESLCIAGNDYCVSDIIEMLDSNKTLKYIDIANSHQEIESILKSRNGNSFLIHFF